MRKLKSFLCAGAFFMVPHFAISQQYNSNVVISNDRLACDRYNATEKRLREHDIELSNKEEALQACLETEPHCAQEDRLFAEISYIEKLIRLDSARRSLLDIPTQYINVNLLNEEIHFLGGSAPPSFLGQSLVFVVQGGAGETTKQLSPGENSLLSRTTIHVPEYWSPQRFAVEVSSSLGELCGFSLNQDKRLFSIVSRDISTSIAGRDFSDIDWSFNYFLSSEFDPAEYREFNWFKFAEPALVSFFSTALPSSTDFSKNSTCSAQEEVTLRRNIIKLRLLLRKNGNLGQIQTVFGHGRYEFFDVMKRTTPPFSRLMGNIVGWQKETYLKIPIAVMGENSEGNRANTETGVLLEFDPNRDFKLAGTYEGKETTFCSR